MEKTAADLFRPIRHTRRSTPLIINADDFGQDVQMNQAILECFRKGFCSSATLMPNQSGFEEACQLAHENRLLPHIGIHLVLRDGVSLTQEIRRFPRLCDKEGRLCLARSNRRIPIFYLEDSEKKVLAEEIRAQIRRCRDMGIPLTHADSHYHLHNEWAVASVLLPIVKECEIPHVRISRNMGSRLGPLKRVYKALLNRVLMHAHLVRTNYFGSLGDYLYWKEHTAHRSGLSRNEPNSLELMIHPRFGEGHRVLFNEEDIIPLEEMIQKVDFYQEAVSFSGEKYLK